MKEVREAHKLAGTDYEKSGAEAYAIARHGPDGSQFLDPVFTAYLDHLEGLEVIDVGCGAGPWALYAVDHGAKAVCAIDYQTGMLSKAREAITQAGASDRIVLARADGAALPVKDGRFQLALSINVGCNLPNAGRTSGENPRDIGFPTHFREMARVLQDGGRAVVTAPTSFGEVFTQGDREKSVVLESIQQALDSIGSSRDPEVIKANLNKLTDVLRATFAWRGDRWALITDESDLKTGEEIWRKLPGLTVPNFYHSEQEYVREAEQAGLSVTEEQHRLFQTEEERISYNTSVPPEKHLGPEYVQSGGGKPPFVVFMFEKKRP